MSGLATEWKVPAPSEKVRRDLFEKFQTEGLPNNKKNEAWKYTNLRSLAQLPLAPSKRPDAIEKFQAEKSSLVFLDGHFMESLSSELPSGVTLETSDSQLFDPSSPLDLLNGALRPQAIQLTVVGEATEPVILHFVSTQKRALANLRFRIELKENAKLTLCELFETEAGEGALTNVVTQVHLAQGAKLEQIRLQREDDGAHHLSEQRVAVKRDARFVSHSFGLGGKLGRSEILVDLDEKGASCQLNGLFFGVKDQHLDCRTVISHNAPQCESEELYKGIVSGTATGIFDGRIVVAKDAQETRSAQTSRNLILSEAASINAKPQLEIYADDVKCSHGATTGQLDKDAIFYLRARGLSEVEARQILTSAFAEELVDKVSVDRFKDLVRQQVASQWEALSAG